MAQKTDSGNYHLTAEEMAFYKQEHQRAMDEEHKRKETENDNKFLKIQIDALRYTLEGMKLSLDTSILKRLRHAGGQIAAAMSDAQAMIIAADDALERKK